MMEAWASGRFRMYPNLPNWKGLPWSLLLVPGWQDLIGRPLHHIVAAQWHTTTHLFLDDLERVPADRWAVASYAALVADPEPEIRRLCAAVSLDWDRALRSSYRCRAIRYRRRIRRNGSATPPKSNRWCRSFGIRSIAPSALRRRVSQRQTTTAAHARWALLIGTISQVETSAHRVRAPHRHDFSGRDCRAPRARSSSARFLT